MFPNKYSMNAKDVIINGHEKKTRLREKNLVLATWLVEKIHYHLAHFLLWLKWEKNLFLLDIYECFSFLMLAWSQKGWVGHCLPHLFIKLYND